MSSIVHEETNRVLIGDIADISGLTLEPAAVAAPGDNVIENVISFTIGPAAVGETRRMRADVVELDFGLGGSISQVVVVPYKSRKSPVGVYNTIADTGADTWQSYGGITILNVPSAAGGNATQIRMNGSRLLTFKVMAMVGTGTLRVRAYAYLNRTGVV